MNSVLPELYMLAVAVLFSVVAVSLAIWETRRFDRRWGKRDER